jgi:hypothetical protein
MLVPAMRSDVVFLEPFQNTDVRYAERSAAFQSYAYHRAIGWDCWWQSGFRDRFLR